MERFCYVVTDIEVDGPDLDVNAMLSFASVAVDQSGIIFDQFEACLAPWEGAVSNPATLAWLKSHPEAWAGATRDPRPPAEVMQAYRTWLRGLAMPAVFVAHPLVFDGVWMDWYLRKFLDSRLGWGPLPGDPLFHGTALDLPSLIMGRLGWDYRDCRRENYPAEWFGGHAHSHRAIDDALGYANILSSLLALGPGAPLPRPRTG